MSSKSGAYSAATARSRFYRYIRIGDGCWEWQGQVTRGGYGLFGVSGKSRHSAHRAAWMIFKGQIPPKMCVLHRCDNRRCVRLDHLFLGDHRANMADMREKSRAASGSRNARAVLTEESVRAIRAEFLSVPPPTLLFLAKKYGVGASAIGRARDGVGWADLGAHLPVPKFPQRSGCEKLDAAKVGFARSSSLSAKELAGMFGVTVNTMYRAIKGLSWKHAGGIPR